MTWTQLTHLAEVLLPLIDGVAVDPDLQLRSVHWLLLVLQTQAPQVPVPAISRPTRAVAPERMPGAEVVSLDVIAAVDSQWHVINPPAPGHDKRGGASGLCLLVNTPPTYAIYGILPSNPKPFIVSIRILYNDINHLVGISC